MNFSFSHLRGLFEKENDKPLDTVQEYKMQVEVRELARKHIFVNRNNYKPLLDRGYTLQEVTKFYGLEKTNRAG